MPPTARPKTLVMKRVKLKAGFRPMMSEIVPQKTAPMQSPAKRDKVVYRTFVELTPYSLLSEGKVKATPCSHKLSASQPNPDQTEKSASPLLARYDVSLEISSARSEYN